MSKIQNQQGLPFYAPKLELACFPFLVTCNLQALAMFKNKELREKNKISLNLI
jgi:hypothetical protein